MHYKEICQSFAYDGKVAKVYLHQTFTLYGTLLIHYLIDPTGVRHSLSHTHTHAHRHTHKHTHTDTHAHTRTQTHTHMYTHIRTQTHTQTHTHTYTPQTKAMDKSQAQNDH